jgi:hypothetical protein
VPLKFLGVLSIRDPMNQGWGERPDEETASAEVRKPG